MGYNGYFKFYHTFQQQATDNICTCVQYIQTCYYSTQNQYTKVTNYILQARTNTGKYLSKVNVLLEIQINTKMLVSYMIETMQVFYSWTNRKRT